MKAIIIPSYYYFARKRRPQGGGVGTPHPLRIRGQKVYNLCQHINLIFLSYIANQHISFHLINATYIYNMLNIS